MTGWSAEDRLYLRLGTETPNWCLAADSDTLFLSAGNTEKGVAVPLNDAQVAQIRADSANFIRITVRLTILGAYLQLYLVGRKVSDQVWKGVASGDPDFLRAEMGLVERARTSRIIDLGGKRGKKQQMSSR